MASELRGDIELELLPPEHAILMVTTTENGGEGEASTLDYPTRGTKFQYCDSVTIYFGENYLSLLIKDDEVVPTEITYVGFKGVGTSVKRKAVKAVYESRGMTKDHKVLDGECGAKSFM